MIKNLPAMQETWVQSLGREDPAMATHSSILAWRIPWIEEPGRLQSMRSQRVGHDWSDWVCMYEWPSGFPYFLQFKSEFGNKEFMIWAKVSSWVWPEKHYFAKALYAMVASFSLTSWDIARSLCLTFADSEI